MTIDKIGDAIKKARLERGWSQADLANKTGLSQGTISRIEKGVTTPNYQSIASLSAVLGMSSSTLNETAESVRQSYRLTRKDAESEVLSVPLPGSAGRSETMNVTPRRPTTIIQLGIHESSNIGKSPSPTTTSINTNWTTANGRTLYGRQAEMARVHSLIGESRTQIIVLEGIAGVGKTAIAENLFIIAQSENLVDLAVWITAKGRPKLNCNDILDDIALRLDYPYLIRLSYKEKEEGICQVLRTQRSLIVLDELENIEAEERINVISMFMRSPRTCQFILTTQISLGVTALANDSFEVLPICGLSASASAELLQNERHRLQLQRAVSEDMFSSLHSALAGNALALKLAVAQFRITADDPNSFSRGTSAAGRDMFSYLFNKAWSNMSPSAQLVLGAVSLFASHFSKPALAAAAGVAASEPEAVDEVIRLLLIEPMFDHQHMTGRFDAHQLVRSFARFKLRQIGRHDVFLVNLAMFYLKYCKAHEVSFWEGREAYSYLEEERSNIISIMANLQEARHYDAFVELTRHMTDYLIVRGDWKTCFMSGKRAATLARNAGDLESYAWLLVHSQGYLLVNTGEIAKGIIRLKRAFITYGKLENESGQSEAGRNLGRAYRKMNRTQTALDFYVCSLSLAEKQCDARLVALALNEIGKLERDLTNYAKAKQLFDRALSTIGEVDSSIRAGILCNLSGVSLKLGLSDNALSEARESLDFFQKIDNKEGIATSSFRLALIHKDANNLEALKYARRSFFEYERLGMAGELATLETTFGGLGGD